MHTGTGISRGYTAPANGPLGVNDQRFMSAQHVADKASRYQQLVVQFQPSVRIYNVFWWGSMLDAQSCQHSSDVMWLTSSWSQARQARPLESSWQPDAQ